MVKEFEIVTIADVKEGDLLDLHGDQYADPEADNTLLKSELAQVVEVNHETPRCISLGIEGFDLVGFPPHHYVWRKKPEE